MIAQSTLTTKGHQTVAMASAMLQRPSNAQLYNSMHSQWPRGDAVRISVGDFPNAFDIPLAFLRGSGSNTYAFVAELVQELVCEPGELVYANAGPAFIDVDVHAAPDAGRLLAFQPVDRAVGFTWASGPDGRYRGRPHPPAEAMDDSASLDASQISVLQVRNRLLYSHPYRMFP
jgi:hypothetical protein